MGHWYGLKVWLGLIRHHRYGGRRGGGIKYEREEKRFSLILPQIAGGGEGGSFPVNAPPPPTTPVGTGIISGDPEREREERAKKRSIRIPLITA